MTATALLVVGCQHCVIVIGHLRTLSDETTRN